MARYEENRGDLGSAPTQDSQLYPETDGKPMAASDEHRRVLTNLLRLLETFFARTPDTYVSGDILMYYVEGDPRKVVSPDVLVTFGIGQKRRKTYRVWQEGKCPDFVLELSSQTTYRNDLAEKMELYAMLGIPEYFLVDIEGLYLPTPLMGFRLVDGVYDPILPGREGEVHASVLGLDFHLRLEDIQLYDSARDQWLQLPEEAAEARAEQEASRAEQAEARAEQETTRAEAAESAAAALRAELDRLRGNH